MSGDAIAEGALEFEAEITDATAASIPTRLRILEQKKTEIEEAIVASQHYLQSTPVGSHGSLVDAEGFPRSDVDHYAVRKARNAIDCGRHDVRRLNDRMHSLLTLRSATTAHHSAPASEPSSPPPPKTRPIFRVTAVTEGTPASEAGLKIGDRILRFGSVATADLRAVASLLQQSIHQTITVTVALTEQQGAATTADISLVPRPLPTGGLLGCVLAVE